MLLTKEKGALIALRKDSQHNNVESFGALCSAVELEMMQGGIVHEETATEMAQC